MEKFELGASVADLPIYTEIYKAGGKRYLFDRRNYETKKDRLARLPEILEGAATILSNYGYPTAEEWQRAALLEGEEGISRLVAAEVEKNIKRLKMPAFVAEQIRKGSLADLPQALLDEAQELRGKWLIAIDGLPITPEDLSFSDERLIIDYEAAAQKLKEGYSLLVPPERDTEAAALKDMIKTARTLNEAGVDIQGALKTFLGNYLNPATYPDIDNEAAILITLNTNRHQTAEQLRLSNPNYYYGAGGAREKEA